MTDRYIAVEWPECQYFLEEESTCFDPDKNIWFVREDIYNKM